MRITGLDHYYDSCVDWRTVTHSGTHSGPTPDVAAGLDELSTEAWEPGAADLDLRPTADLVALMNEQDSRVPLAVAQSADELTAAIDAIAERMQDGGRLVYVGAGTSGRLAVVDAAECESTFSTPPGLVVALIAGGSAAAASAQEHAEDDEDAGRSEIRALGIGPADSVVGLSASGRTPYVLGAIAEAAAAGALTVAVTSVERSELGALAEHEIAVVVGPEVIAGSTRLKAGTAQKLVLNTISTVVMVRLGKTYGNLMVDLVASNAKLRDRVRRIVGHATGAARDEVEAALEAADGDARVAIVMLAAGVGASEARSRLDAAGGVVRKALG
jgi:N-acetylmuramic acid 6-phosphate etherase